VNEKKAQAERNLILVRCRIVPRRGACGGVDTGVLWFVSQALGYRWAGSGERDWLSPRASAEASTPPCGKSEQRFTRPSGTYISESM
jgi:hypothetical protein